MENIAKVKYSHASGSRSAAKAVRYVSRRPEQVREQDREPDQEQRAEATVEANWRDLRAEEGRTMGDEAVFREEANRRRNDKRESAAERGVDLSKDKSPGAAQYVHVMISPEHEMSDEELKTVGREWTRDRETGREYAHYGAIHRDTEHPHLHLLIARDKLPERSQELAERKEASIECIRTLERERELEHSLQRPERQLERECAAEHERRQQRRELIREGRDGREMELER